MFKKVYDRLVTTFNGIESEILSMKRLIKKSKPRKNIEDFHITNTLCYRFSQKILIIIQKLEKLKGKVQVILT